MNKRLGILFGLLLLPASLVWAEYQTLEKVARTYAVAQPGLQSYKTTINTDKIGQLLEQMTAKLPADAPRPPVPKVVKYWSRATESSVIRAEGGNVFPYVQEMVKRFSTELAIELRSFLLPVAKAGERAALLEKSHIKRSENLLGETRIETLVIDFTEPADLNGAFYGYGLAIPQQQIKLLVIDLDLGHEIVRRFEVTTAAGELRTVEVRHFDIRGEELLNEIQVTSPDGLVDDRFKVRFDLIEGFWLPVRMYHDSLMGNQRESLYVKFIDYEVNADLPEDVNKLLQP